MEQYIISEIPKKDNFIQNKFGYCFYTLDINKERKATIYNLYVYPEHRKKGHAKRLITLVINEIRNEGYFGKIQICPDPKENSIPFFNLCKFYIKLGLKLIPRKL